MREIKFRGKTLYSREWRYGSLEREEPQNKYYIMDNETGDGITVDEETIGQFTGLYDKNKVPIYEGDIVKKPEWMGCYDEEICLCIYNQENNTSPIIGFGLYTKNKLTGRYQDLVESDEWDECEVIGNIYENSDLLGE